MNRSICKWMSSGLFLRSLLTSGIAEADAIDRLDATRYGPGTLIAAMEELSRTHPPAAVAPLLLLVGHEDADVARMAAWLLRRMGQGSAGAGNAGTVLADSPSMAARIAAATALGELRDAGCVAPLSAALSGDSEPEVRAAAARALGALHRSGARQPLLTAVDSINEPEPLVRAAAAAALGSTPGTTMNDLVLALRDGDPRVRVEAAWAMGRQGFQTAVGNLQGALQDPDCRVGAAAAWALAQLNDDSVVDALLAATQGPCRLTAQAAHWALSVIPH